MPPPESNLSLSDAEKALLRRWVQEGADYRPHWAFQPVRSRPDSSPAAGVSTNPIDGFIATRLAAAGLRPSPAASRETFIRRAALTLTGLPPTPDEIDGFLADGSPTAFERVVDRYLASPAYGERMAMDWLDLARYADTYGYQADVERDMSPYRDWVIRAFNSNLSYDQFLTWQLAGDLLPGATRDQRIATAFNRLHRQTNEGGSVEDGVPHRVRGGSGQHLRHRHARPDARVCPVSRPQVRSDHPARLLLAVRVLQQYR